MAALALPAFIGATVLNAVGAQQQGAAADRAATIEAQQMRQQAGQVRASAQREALEQGRQTRLLLSRQQALAGGSASDPGVVTLASNLAAEGELRAASSLYEGEEQARGMEFGADMRRWQGRQARRAGNLKAVSSILTAAAAGAKFGGAGGGEGFGTGRAFGNRDYGEFL